jgi:DNA-binding MarR family transcriptional regulator
MSPLPDPPAAVVQGEPAACSAPGPATAPPFRADQYTLDESVGYLMRQALVAFSRRADRELRALDMTGLQVLPLLLIAKQRCRTAAALARNTGNDPGATTRMLDRLQAKGLVSRARTTADRRQQVLELTPAGAALAAQMPAAMTRTHNALLEGFSADDIAQLKSLLRRIVARGDALAAAEPPLPEVEDGGEEAR